MTILTPDEIHRLHKPGVTGSSPVAASEIEIDHEPAEVHHGRPGVSTSQLKLLRESPAAFYDRFISKSPQGGYSSDALAYGTLLHLWAEVGERQFWPRVVRPVDTLVTAAGAFNANGKKWLTTLEPDQIPLAPADEAKLRPQTQRLLGCPAVLEILADVQDVEFNVQWKWNGHACRGRVDGRTSRFLFDWKSTRDKHPSQQWWRSAMEFGYHLQAAMYQHAGSLAGWPDEPLRFIVTSTVYPYDCCVRWLPQQVVEHGKRECLRLLDELLMRRDFDMWESLDSQSASELYFPAYALKGLK